MTFDIATYTTLHTKHGSFYYRPETWDINIINEVCRSSGRWTYASLCTFEKDDVWFDLGGHISTFACRFANQVKCIYSFEPDKENIFLFRHNILRNDIGNVALLPKAVTAIETDEVAFYLSTKKSTAGHTLKPTRGRTKVSVRAQSLASLVEECHPNKLKIDIEGEEQALFEYYPMSWWQQFDEVVLEWHFKVNNDPKCKKYYSLIERLKTAFPSVEYVNAHPGAWIAIIHFKK